MIAEDDPRRQNTARDSLGMILNMDGSLGRKFTDTQIVEEVRYEEVSAYRSIE